MLFSYLFVVSVIDSVKYNKKNPKKQRPDFLFVFLTHMCVSVYRCKPIICICMCILRNVYIIPIPADTTTTHAIEWCVVVLLPWAYHRTMAGCVFDFLLFLLFKWKCFMANILLLL